jgi:CPA2 family monovalent cation:H+ antiporter-2
MMFDPRFVLENPAFVLGVLAIILVAKPLAALAIVALLGYSARTGLTVAIGLAQIGEFSFILADVARKLGVLPGAGNSVLVAGALISITLNPILFRACGSIEAWLHARPRLWRWLNARAEARGAAREGPAARAFQEGGAVAVVVGHGPVGQTVTRLLREFGIPPVVIELNVDTVTNLVNEGQPAVYGDASREEVLRAAGVEAAKYLVVTLPDLASRIPVVLAAREMNPDLRILVRARYLRERSFLEEIGATAVTYEESETAVGLAEYLLREAGATEARIQEEAERIREELALRPSGAAPADPRGGS